MKIIKNLSWIFFANVISSFTKWLMVIFIAKSLTATEVGLYSLAFAITAPITLFANMKLRSLYITGKDYNLSDYQITRNLLSIITFFVITFIALFIYFEYLWVILFIGLSKLVDLQSDLYYAVPHKNNELDVVGKLMISKQIILIIAFGITLFGTENLSFSLLIQIILQLIFLFVIERRYILKHFKLNREKSSIQDIKSILLLGLPLGLVQMMFSINTNFPRYLLEFFEGPRELGYFSAIMYITVVANLFMSSISQVFLPKLSSMFLENKISEFKKNLYLYLSITSIAIGLVLVIFSVFFGEFFLQVVYGKEYAVYNNILILSTISVSVNLVSWNFDTALMAMRYISIQPKIMLFTLLITVIMGYILISNNGVVGASLTLIITAITQLLLRVYFVEKKLNSIQFKYECF